MANWKAIRREVWLRDGPVCQVCDRKITENDYQCGHIVDRCVGGSDDLSNLVVMCTACNQLKPIHKTPEDYRAWVASGGWESDIMARLFKKLAALPEKELAEIDEWLKNHEGGITWT